MSSITSALASQGIATTTTGTATAKASSGLGQSDFLKLLTAQLQNQDPFSPVDNTQMVAQMAQISTSSGISDMSTTLKAISDKLGATTTSDAASYVGKTVLTAGDTAYARTSGGIAGAVELGADASDVNVTITSSSGAVLKTIALGKQSAGTASFDWDGTTDAGDAAGNGPFKVSVAAQSGGQSVTATPLVWAPVQSVAIPASGAAVLTLPGLGQVSATAVRQIG